MSYKPVKVASPSIPAASHLPILRWPTKVSNFVNVHTVTIHEFVVLFHAMAPVKNHLLVHCP